MYEGHEDPRTKKQDTFNYGSTSCGGGSPLPASGSKDLVENESCCVCMLGAWAGSWGLDGVGSRRLGGLGCRLWARLWKNRSGGEEKSRLPLCCRRAGRDLGHLNQLSWRLSRWHLWATAACSNLQLADRRDTCLCPSRYALANATKTAAATRRELAIH